MCLRIVPQWACSGFKVSYEVFVFCVTMGLFRCQGLVGIKCFCLCHIGFMFVPQWVCVCVTVGLCLCHSAVSQFGSRSRRKVVYVNILVSLN
jgi:hypothetical protein